MKSQGKNPVYPYFLSIGDTLLFLIKFNARSCFWETSRCMFTPKENVSSTWEIRLKTLFGLFPTTLT